MNKYQEERIVSMLFLIMSLLSKGYVALEFLVLAFICFILSVYYRIQGK